MGEAMPSLVLSDAIAKVRFMADMHKLPTAASWQQPSGDPGAPHYSKSLQNDMVAIPQCIPPLFFPQNPHKYHQDSCDKIGQGFSDFITKMLQGIQFGHTMWKLQAKFQNLMVNALTAMGTPGCLDGPSLESLIKNSPSCAAMSGNLAAYRDAVAAGLAKSFKNWQDNVMVPGLPWYPAFVAFPGPMAPPMPNIPMPLITCISPMMTEIILPNTMSSNMANALSGDLKQKDPDKQYQSLFDAISTACALGFVMWLPAQQVMLVLGKGPIPTFAPPFVPVGPVVMGDNIAIPGHLMA
jgi:hypothetical protein